MKSAANVRFWKGYAELPPGIQRLTRKNYGLWTSTPKHRSLRFKKVGEIWSARVGDDYRALAQLRGEMFYWFWIGPHDEYEQVIREIGRASCRERVYLAV